LLVNRQEIIELEGKCSKKEQEIIELKQKINSLSNGIVNDEDFIKVSCLIEQYNENRMEINKLQLQLDLANEELHARRFFEKSFRGPPTFEI